MQERQTNTPSENTLPISVQLGELHTEVADTSARSATAGATVEEMSIQSEQNSYATRFVDDVHDYIREHIRNADRKAVFFFGSTTAVLAFLHSVGASDRWLKSPYTWNLLDAITFVGMLGIAAGALSAAFIVVPRLPGSTRGLLYFNAIAEHSSPAEYAGKILGTSQQVLINEKAKHCYVLAGVCRAKFRWLSRSLWLSFVGLVCTFAFLLLGYSST